MLMLRVLLEDWLILTLQDLQGDEIKTKHKEVFDNQIDLLIIDETHFGARASEYGKVLREEKSKEKLSEKEIKNELKVNDATLDELDITVKVLNPNVRLHLSGTPYRILMGSEFTDDDIIAFYQFTDIAEDQAKWDSENLSKDEKALMEKLANSSNVKPNANASRDFFSRFRNMFE